MSTVDLSIKTTDGQVFTSEEQRSMACLIYKRFGSDPEAAADAWQRMLQNGSTVGDFMTLVESGRKPEFDPDNESHVALSLLRDFVSRNSAGHITGTDAKRAVDLLIKKAGMR